MAIKKRLSHSIIYCSECHGLVNDADTTCVHCNGSFALAPDSFKIDTGQSNDLLIHSDSGLVLIYDEFHPPTELINSLIELAKLGTTWGSKLLKNKYKSEYLFYIDTYDDYEDKMAISILLTFNKPDDEFRLRHYKKSINKYLLNLSSSTMIIGKLDNVSPGELLPPLFKKFVTIPGGNYSISVFEKDYIEDNAEDYVHILSKQEARSFKLSNFLFDIGCSFSTLSVIFLSLLYTLIIDDIGFIILLNLILWVIILFLREIPSIQAVKKKTSDYKSSIQNLPFYLLEFNRADSVDGLITGGIWFDFFP